MSYRVDWVASAHDRLERIWMAAADSRLVLRAANAIDDLLAADPDREEAIVSGNERTLIFEPLSVDFRVSVVDRTVLILSVWWIGFLDENET